MKLVYQIPRNSLAWLLGAYVLVIAPHVGRLPIWITLAGVVALGWRIQVHRGLWSFPPRWVRYLLAGICGAGLIVGYGRLLGLEPMVALLIIGFTLKLLEMYQRRDAILVIYLAYFVVATQLIFDQGIASTAYVFGAAMVVTTALMGLNQSSGHLRPWRSLKLGGGLLLQALPIMLLLFILMPRIGALWSVPSQQQAGKTGVSDTMTPGNFSKLTRSGELAFRVAFDGEIPPQESLYWRGLVLSRFDGRTWSQAQPFDYARDGTVVQWPGSAPVKWESLVERRGDGVSYEVIMEASHQPWLYALATPRASNRDIGFTRDFRLVKRLPIDSRYKYTVTSWLEHAAEPQTLPEWRYRNETRLPGDSNPRTRAMAERWAAEESSSRALVARVLNFYNRTFTYTLKPPVLGRHTADEFLFDSQRGFCEHFANSFVVFMRAAGIPARVVVGYQGGEISPLQNYVLVHQFDAHAWAEVWLEGSGWQRVDPTAAVAPERIERGFQSVFSEQSGFLADSLFSLVRYSNVGFVNWFRLQLDYMDYAWYRYVLGYDNQLQVDLLTRLLGKLDAMRMVVFFLGCSGVILLAICWFSMWRYVAKRDDGVAASYAKFCKRLAAAGLERKAGEVPAAFAARASEQRPDLRAAIDHITQSFCVAAYAGDIAPELQQQQARELKTAVSGFRPGRGVIYKR